jgi:hypothetical protein
VGSLRDLSSVCRMIVLYWVRLGSRTYFSPYMLQSDWHHYEPLHILAGGPWQVSGTIGSAARARYGYRPFQLYFTYFMRVLVGVWTVGIETTHRVMFETACRAFPVLEKRPGCAKCSCDRLLR